MPKKHHYQAECDHLIAVARGEAPLQRDLLVNSIEKLFLTEESSLTDKEQAIMTDILRHLIRDVEVALRKNLADKLAKLPHPPQELVNTLADDSIDVCYTLLVESPLISDDTLLHIIKHRSQQHQLAISMRRNLSNAVSDALVATADVDVITSLLNNESAQISAATLEYLAHESKRVTRYQRPLLNRSDLSPDIAKKMYAWVSASLREQIVQQYALDQKTLDDALAMATLNSVASSPQAANAAQEKAENLVDALEKKQRLTAKLLLKTLNTGEIPLFEVMLARMLNVKHEVVVPLLYDSDLDNIAIAARFLQMKDEEFKEFLRLLAIGLPNRFGGDNAALQHYFYELKLTAAEAVIKTWRRKPNYLLPAISQPHPKPPLAPL